MHAPVSLNKELKKITHGKEASPNTGNQIDRHEPDALNLIPEYQDKSQLKMNLLFDTEKQNEIGASRESSYMTAIISEIQNFMKELQDLKQLQSLVPNISDEEDMTFLKVFALNQHNFQKDINETMQSLSCDIYTLKNVLLEGFVMVEEACSRERRRNDHSYITMLKERALDPLTAKRMQKMNQHYQYLCTQLQELSDKLDQDWIHLVSDKKKLLRNNQCISSTQAIYKTIVNNRKIIHNLKRQVDLLQKKAEEKKNTTKGGAWGRYHNRSMQEDLSKLADEFLQVKISYQEEREITTSKKLSHDSLNFLKSFLRQSNIITVRPMAVYSPSQSRLLSNAMLSEEPDQVQETSLRPVSVQTSSEKETSGKTSFEIGKPDVGYSPIYEPVTPPDVTSPQPVNKVISGTTCLKERFLENIPIQRCVTATMNAMSSPVNLQKESIDQAFISSHAKGYSGNHSCTSTPSGTKPPVFSHVTPETVSIASVPNLCSKTVSGAPGIQKIAECISKINNGVAPSSTFSSQSSHRKDAAWSVSTATSSTSIADPRNCVSTESSQLLDHPQVSLQPLSNTVSSHTNIFNLPSIEASQTSDPSTAESETVNSQVLLDRSDSITKANSAVRFFFQKPAGYSTEQATFSNDNFCTTGFSSSSESPCCFSLDTVSAVDCIPSINEGEDSGGTCMEKSSTRKPVICISNQAAVSDVPNVDSFAALNTQPDTSSLSDSKKQSVPLSDVLVSNTKDLTVIESETNTAPQLTNSATIITTPAVTSASSAVQSNLAVPESESVSLATLPSETTTTTESKTLFGQLNNLSSSLSTPKIQSDSSVTSSFGMKPTQLFGQPSSESSFFPSAKTDAAPVFGQIPTTQATFGQPTSTESFSSSSGGFFSQTPAFGTPDTTTKSDFNSQSSTFSFGKSAFGQASGFSFSQNSSSVFGQGSFFSGLGGKPSEENASKNVFGINSGVKSTDSSNLFRNSSVSSFSGVNSGSFSGSGSFSSGGGSVAQSGFGSFQQITPQQPGGFGAAPAFGGAPAFGSTPAFGASASFGSGNPLSSVFGQQQVSSNFSNFANASSPTFGSLASQTSSFVKAPASGFGSQGNAFGSPPAFGGTSFGGQASSFGNPSSPPTNSSAFTQWRN